MTQNLKDTGYAKCVGEDKSHLKLTVTENGDHRLGGIGFNIGNKIDLIINRRPFKAVYTIDENHWNGQVNLQLKIKDIKS
jgi:single-stranded-DNA-specific exonuclease